MVPNLHSELGITVGLMLWMCEPLFSTVKSAIMGSGVCVADWIVALAAKGVYAGDLIKRR